VPDRKVNLFVVGAMKAGTTSFIEMLSGHPEIYFSPVKEPHYFVNSLPKRMYEPSRFFNLDTYLTKTFPEPLHITHLKTEDQYKKIFSKAQNEKYLAEGSTGYLHAQESAQMIFEYNHKAKIIVLTREPIKRAFSHYKMDLGLGRTKATFEVEIKKELNDYQVGILDTWGYIKMSLYADAIKRYKNLFQDNVLVISLESLIEEKENTLRAVFQFLEIENREFEVVKVNISSSLRFQKVFYFLKQLGLKDLFSYIVPVEYRQKLFQLFSKKQTKTIELNAVELKTLQDIFNEDQQKLKEL